MSPTALKGINDILSLAFWFAGKHALGGALLHSLGAIYSCVADTSLLRLGMYAHPSLPLDTKLLLLLPLANLACVFRNGRACIDLGIFCAEDPLPSADRCRALKLLVTPALPRSPELLPVCSGAVTSVVGACWVCVPAEGTRRENAADGGREGGGELPLKTLLSLDFCNCV